MNKDIEYYMNLPWSFSIERRDDAGVYYFARVNELTCFSDGKTPAEAMSNILDALKFYLETCIEDGAEIKEPISKDEFKGTITYRTQPEKHYKLAREAQRRDISVNKLIDQAVDILLSA